MVMAGLSWQRGPGSECSSSGVNGKFSVALIGIGDKRIDGAGGWVYVIEVVVRDRFCYFTADVIVDLDHGSNVWVGPQKAVRKTFEIIKT
jgi:hypothetical protein